MQMITGNDIGPFAARLARVGSEDTLAAPLVFGEMSHDSPERCLPTLADAISDVVANGEGA